MASCADCGRHLCSAACSLQHTRGPNPGCPGRRDPNLRAEHPSPWREADRCSSLSTSAGSDSDETQRYLPLIATSQLWTQHSGSATAAHEELDFAAVALAAGLPVRAAGPQAQNPSRWREGSPTPKRPRSRSDVLSGDATLVPRWIDVDDFHGSFVGGGYSQLNDPNLYPELWHDQIVAYFLAKERDDEMV